MDKFRLENQQFIQKEKQSSNGGITIDFSHPYKKGSHETSIPVERRDLNCNLIALILNLKINFDKSFF